LSPEAALGKSFFESTAVDGSLKCAECHSLPLGTNAQSSEDGEPQQFKISHLRNLYQKVGMFGVNFVLGFAGIATTGSIGDQVRGFGYLHDGSIDTVLSFLDVSAFTFPTTTDHRNVTQFMLEFDTGLAPIVGQQVTKTVLNSSNPGDVNALVERAKLGECDLIARGIPDPSLGLPERGFFYQQRAGDFGPSFYADSQSAPKQSPEILLQTLKLGGWLTFTCVPPGSGGRMALDRDCDNTLDFDETNKNPNPISYPSQQCPI
jgi:hypothetical protein